MKKGSKIILVSLVVVLSLVFFSASPDSASAFTIVTVQGTSGQIEYMNNVNASASDRILAAWGLDFYQNDDSYNWVHYSIPVPLGSKTRYLLVYYQTGSGSLINNSSITAIHVYDGPTKIYETTVDLVGGPAFHLIDMGSDKTTDYSLGLSIQTHAGTLSVGSNRIRIFSVMGEHH